MQKTRLSVMVQEKRLRLTIKENLLLHISVASSRYWLKLQMLGHTALQIVQQGKYLCSINENASDC